MVPASAVAKVTGFLPNFDDRLNVFEIFFEFVYQGLEGLRLQDEETLGIRLVTKREQTRAHMKTLSPRSRTSVERAVRTGQASRSMAGAQAAAADIDVALEKAPDRTAARILSTELRGKLNMGFGTRKEAVCCAAYERSTKQKVTQRNDAVWAWAWPAPSVKQDVYRSLESWRAFVSLMQYPRANRLPRLRGRVKMARSSGGGGGGGDGGGGPLFVISGKVDGVSTDADDGRQILIEVKNRTREAKIYAPPATYDRIQTSIYMHMFQGRDTDFVQCFVRNNKQVRMTATRLSLRDNDGKHRTAFRMDVLPRLYCFCDAVEHIRNNELRRLYLLQALQESRCLSEPTINMHEVHADLYMLCPFLVKLYPLL